MHSLEYHFNLNITRNWDYSHGCNKDLHLALRETKLFDFILLFMVSANVLHGPDKDDQRWHEVRDAMRVAYKTLDHTTPLFAAQAMEIHSALKLEGFDFEGKYIEKECWD